MLNNITPKGKIQEELEKYQFHAEIEMSEDADEAVVWANEALVYLARTGKLIADCQYHRDRKARSELVDQIKTISGFKTATLANRFADSLLEEEEMLLKWSERLNAALARKIDFCRSLISKAKEEMKYSQTLNNGNH